uniref:Uncharacterized protein n=1 Tax=Equus caballus TaxID=9796 RepID=A0A9L0RCV5_HORSE
MAPIYKSCSCHLPINQGGRKIDNGQPMMMWTPHQVSSPLETKGHLWLSQNRVLQYQAVLLDSPQVSLKPCHTRNPATLLPDSSGPITHACLEGIDQVYSNCKDLQREPLPNAEEVWFFYGSSFTHNGQRRAGYAAAFLQATHTLSTNAPHIPPSHSGPAPQRQTLRHRSQAPSLCRPESLLLGRASP